MKAYRIFLVLWVACLIVSCSKIDLNWNLDKVKRNPIASLDSISNITNVSALANCKIEYNGEDSITRKGVCYSTINNTPSVNDSLIINHNNSNSFHCQLINLTKNTTYFIRAFAKNTIGISYSKVLSFTTSNINGSLATLTTNPITSISNSVAISGGNITSDGGNTIFSSGICYSTSPNPTISNNCVFSGINIGNFSTTMIGLTSNTTYYVRAFATNFIGTAYGNQQSFTTNPQGGVLATISTNLITSITNSSATSGGNITNDGGSTISANGICYSTSPNPTILDSYLVVGSGIGNYSANLTNLQPNTTYYTRAFATNSIGTAYGNQLIFTTLSLGVPMPISPINNFAVGSITYVLECSCVVGATSYDFEICQSSTFTGTIYQPYMGGGNNVANNCSNSQQSSNTYLQNNGGTTLYWHVRANVGTYHGAWSSTAVFIDQ